MHELGKTSTNLSSPTSTSFTTFPDRYFLFNPELLKTEKATQISSGNDQIQGSHHLQIMI